MPDACGEGVRVADEYFVCASRGIIFEIALCFGDVREFAGCPSIAFCTLEFEIRVFASVFGDPNGFVMFG